MKLTPRSMARCRAASDVLSLVGPQSPPMAQAPNPMAEIFQPMRPNVRYSISPPCLLSAAKADFNVAHSGWSRTCGLWAPGKDGFAGSGWGAGWDTWDGWDTVMVELEHASPA